MKQKLIILNQELNSMEPDINNLKTVNVGSTCEVTALSRVNPDPSSGIYMTSLIQNNFWIAQ